MASTSAEESTSPNGAEHTSGKSLQELLDEAAELAASGAHDESLDVLQEAMVTATTTHGEMHLECAPVYFQYGRMLLESAKASVQDLFSRLLMSRMQPDSDGEDEGPALTEMLHKTVGEVVQTESRDLSKFIGTAGAKDGEEQEGGATSSSSMAGGGETEEEQEASRMIEADMDEQGQDAYDTFALSWDWMDTARLIYTNYIEDNVSEDVAPLDEPVDKDELRRELANVHECLGEHALETDKVDTAILEYERCLAVRKATHAATDRILGETHFYTGLAYQIAQQPEKALAHYQEARAIIEAHVEGVKKRLAECTPAHADTKETLSAEVVELQLVMEELSGRMMEVTGVEKLKPGEMPSMKTQELTGTTADEKDIKKMGVFGKAVGDKRKRDGKDEAETGDAKRAKADSSQ